MRSAFRFEVAAAWIGRWLLLVSLVMEAGCTDSSARMQQPPSDDDQQTPKRKRELGPLDGPAKGSKSASELPDAAVVPAAQHANARDAQAREAGRNGPEDSGSPAPTNPPPLPERDAGPGELLPQLKGLFISDTPNQRSIDSKDLEFSVSQVRELHVLSVRSQLLGEHHELRRFYAPSGALYYQKLLAFSTELDAPAPFTAAVSVPHSKQILPVIVDEHAEIAIGDPFQLAGTWISDRGMTGTWTLEVYLDGATRPDGTIHFELVP
jgi:hypothetical protein